MAASLASLLLAASWGWLWTTTAAARTSERKASSLTATGFAERMLRADLSHALRLASPAEGICSAATVSLVDVGAESGMTSITRVTWDPARDVLWRNASGSYLAEHVSGFVIRYLDGDGEELPAVTGGVLDTASRDLVKSVRVEMTVGPEGEERHVVLVEPIAAAGAQ